MRRRCRAGTLAAVAALPFGAAAGWLQLRGLLRADVRLYGALLLLSGALQLWLLTAAKSGFCIKAPAAVSDAGGRPPVFARQTEHQGPKNTPMPDAWQRTPESAPLPKDRQQSANTTFWQGSRQIPPKNAPGADPWRQKPQNAPIPDGWRPTERQIPHRGPTPCRQGAAFCPQGRPALLPPDGDWLHGLGPDLQAGCGLCQLGALGGLSLRLPAAAAAILAGGALGTWIWVLLCLLALACEWRDGA